MPDPALPPLLASGQHAFAGDAAFQPLAARARVAMRLGALARALVVTTSVAVPLYLAGVFRGELGTGHWALIVAVLGVGLVAALVLLADARWRRTCWRLDEDGLSIRRGVVWRSETLVPRSRVQHVDIAHGPVDRRFGLATLRIYTAGTRLASVSLSGLEQARAEALRDALIEEGASSTDPEDAPAANGAASAPDDGRGG